MFKSIQGRRLFVAAIFAVVLLVQSFVLAWSSGAAPLKTQLDQFGNPLCITSMDHGEQQSDHGKLPNCCSVGCGFASSLVAVPVLFSVPVEWPRAAPSWISQFRQFEVAALPIERPGRPRDPPRSSR